MIFGFLGQRAAARAQERSAQAAIDLQREINDENVARQQPFVNQGYQAARLEGDLLGLGGGGGYRYGNVGNNALAGFNPYNSSSLTRFGADYNFIGSPGGPQARGPIYGQQLGYFGAPPQPTAQDRQNSAYDTFLNSGFARSALETTQRDFDDIRGAYGAGGSLLSGSAIGALNDRNRRNTANAFNNYYGALNQNATRGANVAAGVGSQSANFANSASNQLNIAGQAQGQAANALGGFGQSLVNGVAGAIGGFF